MTIIHAFAILCITIPAMTEEIVNRDQDFTIPTVIRTAHPDVMTIPADVVMPVLEPGDPRPGTLVLQQLPTYAGTTIAHTVYLPTDWIPGQQYPVMVEYLGNTAQVRDVKAIGPGLHGGQPFIWVILPFIATDHTRDLDWWWGDVEATVAYAKEAVPAICRQWGGDPDRVVLVGYSRGAIACNYIGLHDEAIAKLWRGMMAISHYDDGHIPWGMTPEEQQLAPERVRRLGRIPQYIAAEHCTPTYTPPKDLLQQLHERNIVTFDQAESEFHLQPVQLWEKTRRFLRLHQPQGQFTFADLPWVNHESACLLRDTPERHHMRAWLAHVISPGYHHDR